MLPNVLQPDTTDHVPVLADEVRRLLAVQPGETVVDATFGAGGHAALLAADLQGDGRFVAIDRDPTVRPYFERFRRRAGVPARLLRGEASLVLEQLAGNGFGADASGRSSAPASSSRRSRARFPHLPASATATRRSASSRPYGSPSTTSSARSRPRCRRPSRCCGPAGASP